MNRPFIGRSVLIRARILDDHQSGCEYVLHQERQSLCTAHVNRYPA